MKLLVAALLAFLIGSATTAIFLSCEKREPVPTSTTFHSNENAGEDAKLARIYERLTNIETLLAQSQQKQLSSTQVTTTESSKPEGKDSLDATARATAVSEANEIVERALQSGTVTPSDFNSLAAATVKLSKEEREKLLSKLTMAINADQVHIKQN